MSPSNPPKQEKEPPAEVQPASGKKQDYQTNMPVGEILRRAREHFGQSLADVENAIRIRHSQIDAIEKSQYDKLPGRVYAIGFVRSYSEYLGFDGDKMVALFKSQSLGGKSKPELNFPAPASESRLPPLGLVIASLSVFIAFMVVWVTGKESDPESVSTVPTVAEQVQTQTDIPAPAPVAPAPTKAPASELTETAVPAIPLKAGTAAATTAPAAAPETQGAKEELSATKAPEEEAAKEAAETEVEAETETPAAAPAAAEGITLNVIDSSWVEIKDESGKAIVSRMLKKGDQYFVPNRPDLKMSLGNAGGIEIVMDGKTLPPLGRKGEVRRNISLDLKALKAAAASRE